MHYIKCVFDNKHIHAKQRNAHMSEIYTKKEAPFLSKLCDLICYSRHVIFANDARIAYLPIL